MVSVGVAMRQPPRPPIQNKMFRAVAPEGTQVTPDRPLDLPIRYKDFNLNCRVELPAEADFELLFRRVEHWGDVARMPVFHARFAALRMSTQAKGEGLLTREDLLFESPVGGVQFAPGQPGSVELICRGNRVQATVNGIELGPMETVDDFGGIAFVSRNGTAVVHDLKVAPWPRKADHQPWIVGGVAGLILGLVLGLTCSTIAQVATALITFGFGGFLASFVVFSQLLPATAPSTSGVIFGSLCLLPMAVCLAARAIGLGLTLLVGAVFGLPIGGILLELCARAEMKKLAAFEDRRLDYVFGPNSGSAPFDAVTRMLACKHTKHTLLSQRYDVLLLGGKTFFDFDEAAGGPGRNVSTALPMILRQQLQLPPNKEIYCAAVPTDVPNAHQQFSIYEKYYRDYRPRVVVLGLCDDEERILQRDYISLRVPSGSVLLDLLLSVDAAGSARAQTPEDLTTTLNDFLTLCRGEESELVLAIDNSLPKDLQQVAAAFCTSNGVGCVTGFTIWNGHHPIEALAEKLRAPLAR